MLLTARWDGTTKLWNTKAAQLEVSISGGVIAAEADGSQIGFRNFDEIGFWELERASERRIIHGHVGKGPWCVGFSPNNKALATSGKDGVRIWDRRLQQVARFDLGDTFSAHFSADGKSVLCTGSYGLKRIALGPGYQAASQAEQLVEGPFESSILTSKGLLAAVGRNSVNLIDLKTMKRTQLSGRSATYSVSVSHNNRWAAAGAWHNPDVVVWNLKDRKTRRLPTASSSKVAFSKNDKWLIVSDATEYRFWSTQDWQTHRRVIRKVAAGYPGAIGFSSDGKLVAICISGTQAALLDVDTGKKIVELKTPGDRVITSFAFSSDDKHLAVATNGRVTHLWDLGKVRSRLRSMGLDW